MSGSGSAERSVLFARQAVSIRDQRVFVAKLAALLALLALGAALALRPGWVAVPGVVLLGVMYAHAVELQHQCLHRSAFRRPRPHRWAGVALGAPMLVSYSHYRARHLQHHKHLGTPLDSEFFGFDPRRPVTLTTLLRGMLDPRPTWAALTDIARAWSGRWSYGEGELPERRRHEITTEYRGLGLLLLAVLVAVALGHGDLVLRLWLIPLAVAISTHYLVEIPEHVLCDPTTTDVLRNTRSIRGSWFSTWFTNGNNLHIEHHAAMAVPINQLPARHGEVVRRAAHVERSYPDFYRSLVAQAFANGRARSGGGAAE